MSKLAPDDVAGTYASSPLKPQPSFGDLQCLPLSRSSAGPDCFLIKPGLFSRGLPLSYGLIITEWRSFTARLSATRRIMRLYADWLSGNFGTCYGTVPVLGYTTISSTGRARSERNDMVSVYRWG